jgi:hypothetical protein
MGTPYRSPKYGHLGVHFLCTGPDPNGPRPGERVRAVVFDAKGKITRRFEQKAGAVVDGGYVDFFNSPRCRPSIQRLPLVDVDTDGTETVLLEDFQPSMDRAVFAHVFEVWCRRHGIESTIEGLP